MLLYNVRHSISPILSSMNLIKKDGRQTGILHRISSIELIICTLVDQEAKITLIHQYDEIKVQQDGQESEMKHCFEF